MQNYRTFYFADSYGQGTYGCGEYDSSSTTSCAASSGGNSTGSGSGSLVDTGMMIVLVATVACAIVFISLLVRFWRRPARKPKNNLGDSPTDAAPKK